MPYWTTHLLLGLGSIIIAFLAFALIPGLHTLDMRLASWLQRNAAHRLHSDIVVIDVPGVGRIPEFRSTLAALLQHLAADPQEAPRSIALDIWFDGEIRDSEQELVDAITMLQSHRHPVSIHGVVSVMGLGAQLKEDDAREHALRLYERMDSVGHNYFAHGPGWVFYDPMLPTGRIATAVHLAGRADFSDLDPSRPIQVHIGPSLERSQPAQILSFDPDCTSAFRRYKGACIHPPPNLRSKILIIGRLAEDRPLGADSLSGPEIVAWALNDLIDARAGTRRLTTSATLHLGLVLAMPLSALALFAALLRFLRGWRLRPWRIAALAGMLTLIIPMLLILTARSLGQDYSQVLLPLSLTVVLLGLAAHYRTSANYRAELLGRVRSIHAHVAYDVFISYRSSHAEWVQAELMPSLKALRRADGMPLTVFLDNEKLHSDSYVRQLELAVYESKIFVPVLTPDYFDPDKPYCRWEMTNAFNRMPHAAVRMIPLLHGGYRHQQHGDSQFPALSALHGYRTDDVEWRDKFVRDLLSAAG